MVKRIAKVTKKADKSFPDEINRRLREIMARTVEVHFQGNQSDAAKEIGVSQPHVSQLSKDETDRGFGPLVAIQLAKYLHADMRDMIDLSVDIDAIVFMRSQARVRLEARKFAEKAGISMEAIDAVDEKYALAEKSAVELIALMIEHDAKKYRTANPKRTEREQMVSRLVSSTLSKSHSRDE